MPAVTAAPLFVLDGITLRYPPKTVLNHVGLTVDMGEFLAILGPSASGKTSLLRLFNELDVPTRGSIYYRAKSLSDWPVTELRQQVGMVFQNPVIMAGSVGDNLSVMHRWGKRGDHTSRSELGAILNKVGLPESILSKDARSLSGGEKQRLALARVLLNRPQTLLLDEPTANLDPQLARRILQVVKDLYRMLDLTVILVSHDHILVREFAQRVAILIDGEIVEQGPPEILDSPSTPAARGFLTRETT